MTFYPIKCFILKQTGLSVSQKRSGRKFRNYLDQQILCIPLKNMPYGRENSPYSERKHSSFEIGVVVTKLFYK